MIGMRNHTMVITMRMKSIHSNMTCLSFLVGSRSHLSGIGSREHKRGAACTKRTIGKRPRASTGTQVETDSLLGGTGIEIRELTVFGGDGSSGREQDRNAPSIV